MDSEKKYGRKVIKFTLRLLVWALLALVVIPLILAGLLVIPPIQRAAVKATADYVSEVVGSEVSIGALYFEPFSTIQLEAILVRDVFNDTLIHADVLHLALSQIDLDAGKFELSLVNAESPFFNLYFNQGDTNTNLSYFIDAFSSGDTSEAGHVTIVCDNIIISNGKFAFHDYNLHQRPSGEIDFSHIDIRSFSGSFQNVLIVNDSIRACIENLRLVERSGFIIKHLTTEAIISPRLVSCENMFLQTNSSKVRGSYSMRTEGWGSYADFINQVYLESELINSDVVYNDIAFFAPQVRDLLVPMRFSGHVSGTISNLRGQVDSLFFGESGRVSGRVKIKGLPDVQTMFIDADLTDFFVTVEDAEKVNIPGADGLFRMQLPEEARRLEYAMFSGKFTGFVSDFVAYGQARSGLGNVTLDVNLKTATERLEYSGSLNSAGFDFGRMFDVDQGLHAVAFNLDLEGSGVEKKTFKMSSRGQIAKLDLLGYTYQNMEVDGVFDRQVFNGNVSVEDTNISLRFNGLIDLNAAMPQVKCTANVAHFRPAALGIIPIDTFGNFRANVALEMSGSSSENLSGELRVSDFMYSGRTRSIRLDSIVLTDEVVSSGHRIVLSTDLVSAEVEGRTSLFGLPEAFLRVSTPYVPGLAKTDKAYTADSLQQFSFHVKVSNDTAFSHFVARDFEMSKPLELTGMLDMKRNYLMIRSDTLNWKLGAVQAKGNAFNVEPREGKLRMNYGIRRLELGESSFLENFNILAELRNDSLATVIGWLNETEKADSGVVDMLLYRSEQYPYNVQLNDLNVRIAGNVWKSNAVATLHADTSSVTINQLDLRSSLGSTFVNGTLGTGPDDVMRVALRQINLSYLSRFGLIEQSISGKLIADVVLRRQKNALIADATLKADSLQVDGYEIGSVEGDSKYSNVTGAVDLHLYVSYKDERNVSFIGQYYPNRTSDQLDIEASLRNFRLETIEPFLSDYVEDMEGKLDGSVSITGMINEPELRGSIYGKDARARVKYLNTLYRIPALQISVEPNLLSIDHASVVDEKGSVATATASFAHSGFSDYSYDVFLQARNFQGLNTGIAQNESYYGRANFTGDVSISGYKGVTLIEVDGRTNGGTRLVIPLTAGADVSSSEFIRFVQTKEKFTRQDAFSGELMGLELDFKLSVTDSAEIQIVFDEKIGDVIKVNGKGDILMQIDNKGKFNMYGQYLISRGDYLFTLQNVVNKRFSVRPGSAIVWNGSPYDAKLDITAIHKLKASPMPFMEHVVGTDSPQADKYRQRMAVDVLLKMKGAMLEPGISFDVDLPDLPSSDLANQMLERGSATEQAINEQAFSLLLAKQFSAPGDVPIGNSGAGVGTTYDMLSNQFSNWASQYFDNWDIGVNLSKGDGQSTTDQFGVSVSRQLFDNRLMVEVNGSNQGTGETTQNTSNVVGEVNVEYRINRTGTWRSKFFNEANNYNAVNINQSPYTQGVGVFYQREFDTFGELIRSLRNKERPKEDQPDEDQPVEEEELEQDVIEIE